MTRGDGWSRRGSRMNSKRASRFLFAQKEEGSSPGVFCKEISTDGEGKPGDRRGGHVPGCGVIMMELLPSGKTLVNLSLNFVHFMTHLHIYVCVCVCIEYTHEASLPEEINGNIFSFIRWIEFLKRKIWLEFLFSTTILRGALLQIGRRYLGKIYRGQPLPRWNGSSPFHASPIEIEGSI